MTANSKVQEQDGTPFQVRTSWAAEATSDPSKEEQVSIDGPTRLIACEKQHGQAGARCGSSLPPVFLGNQPTLACKIGCKVAQFSPKLHWHFFLFRFS